MASNLRAGRASTRSLLNALLLAATGMFIAPLILGPSLGGLQICTQADTRLICDPQIGNLIAKIPTAAFSIGTLG